MRLAIICALVAIAMFVYEVYYISQDPNLYTGLGLGNWVACSAMVDIGAGGCLYMLVRVLQSRRVITGEDRYKEAMKK